MVYDYVISTQSLKQIESIKDFDLVRDIPCSFRILAFIVRSTKNFNNIAALKPLFIAVVLFKIECSALVYYLIYNCHIKALEKVQRKYVKYLHYKLHVQYILRRVLIIMFCWEYLILNIYLIEIGRRNVMLRYSISVICGNFNCSYEFANLEANFSSLRQLLNELSFQYNYIN